MYLANIQQVSNSSSFYRETQGVDLSHLLYHNHSSFFHSGGTMNNIGYEGQSPVSIFASPIDKTYLNIISFQQFIQKQLVYLATVKNNLPQDTISLPLIDVAKDLLKALSDLFTQFFASHYQAPKIVTNVETNEITFEITLSPLTKIFINVVENDILLAYRHEKELKRKMVNSENILENFADLFVQYGTKLDLAQGSSIFK